MAKHHAYVASVLWWMQRKITFAGRRAGFGEWECGDGVDSVDEGLEQGWVQTGISVQLGGIRWYPIVCGCR